MRVYTRKSRERATVEEEVPVLLKLLVDGHTNTDAARWPVVDRLIELRDAGLVAPEVWRLVMALTTEYEAELAALRERPLS
jgi:hypothetical protein